MLLAPTVSPTQEIYESTAHVLGQEKARRQMAVLLTRQKMVAAGGFDSASGAILAGRTGSGKTMLARVACKSSGLAFAEINATQYTDKGYVGLDLSQMFLPLLQAAARMYDFHRSSQPYQVDMPRQASTLKRSPEELKAIVEIAESGVLFMDEFDKWMIQDADQGGRNVGRKLQAELLKMVEGSVEWVSDDEEELGVPFDTSRVLFICGGAFVGLTQMVQQRLDRKEENVEMDEGFWDLIQPQDFIKFGIMPELAGRLSTLIFIRPLTQTAMREIISAPGGPVEEYRRRFAMLGVEWAVGDAGVGYLCSIASQLGTGARGIENALWAAFADALFEGARAQGSMRVVYEPNTHAAHLERI